MGGHAGPQNLRGGGKSPPAAQETMTATFQGSAGSSIAQLSPQANPVFVSGTNQICLLVLASCVLLFKRFIILSA